MTRPHPNNMTFLRLSCALVLFALTFGAYAEEFWEHRISHTVDVVYGDDPLQKMDAYFHGQRTGEPDYFKRDANPRPTLVWFHGGGWVAGDKANQSGQLGPFLRRGWNVFNVNYRQGPGTAPLAVEDVMCAYRFIEQQLAKMGQPTDQVVVSGASAGGHLALAVGLLNTNSTHKCKADTPPTAVVNWFGITDIAAVDKYLHGVNPERNYARAWAGSENKVNEVSQAYSPVHLISDQAPAIITIHGTDDSVVPYNQAEALHDALTTPNELVTLADGNHSGFTDAQYQEAMTKIFAFLDAHNKANN